VKGRNVIAQGNTLGYRTVSEPQSPERAEYAPPNARYNNPMDAPSRSPKKLDKAFIALALLGLFFLPFLLITCAVLEYKLFGTNYLEQIGQVSGLHGPLGKLYEALQPYLGW
jgi:hypothetical protein